MPRVKHCIEATAHHEAGHAVAAHLIGIGTRRVTIVPAGQYLGLHAGADALKWLMRIKEYEDVDSGGLRYRAERFVVYTMAGPASEEIYYRRAGKRSGPDGGGKDRNDAEAVMMAVCRGDSAEAELYYPLLKYRAERLSARNWWLVEAVAQALLCKRTLTGAEVKQAIYDAVAARVQTRSRDARVTDIEPNDLD